MFGCSKKLTDLTREGDYPNRRCLTLSDGFIVSSIEGLLTRRFALEATAARS